MGAFRLVLPLFMAIGGVFAWLVTRKGDKEREDPQNQWRDTSLDDWRRERDALAEEERLRRESGASRDGLSEGQAKEADTQKKTHTRMGG